MFDEMKEGQSNIRLLDNEMSELMAKLGSSLKEVYTCIVHIYLN